MVRYLKPGEDFGPAHFAESNFGFSRSAGPTPRSDRTVSDNNRTEAVSTPAGSRFAPQETKMRDGGKIKEIGHAFPEKAFRAEKISIDKMKRSRGAAYKEGGPLKRATGGPIPGTSPAAGASPLTRQQTQTPMAGNPLSRANVTMPAGDLVNLAAGAAKIGAGHAVNALAQVGQRMRQGARPVAMPGNAAIAPAAQSPMGSAPGLQGVPSATPQMKNGGRVRRALGGPMGPQAPMAPPMGGAPMGAMQQMHPMPVTGLPTGAMPGMKKGGFINGAIKHPGRMKEGAAREGVSTHRYMEEHKASPGSLGQAARLGLRMTGGDLSPRRKKG